MAYREGSVDSKNDLGAMLPAAMRGLFWTAHDAGVIRVWYPDGDLCAEIESNFGLGIDAADAADVICRAVNR